MRIGEEGEWFFEIKRKGFGSQAGVRAEGLRLLIQEQKQELGEAETMLEELHKERFMGHADIPRLHFYKGRRQVQQMMKDMLLYRDLTVSAFWPLTEMVKLLTPPFLEEFHRSRVRQNISINVIWPSRDVSVSKNYLFLKSSSDQLREARVAPQGLSVPLGYAVYGHTVRFVSSSKESFGILVENKELADTIRAQFNYIWKLCKRV